MFVYGWLGNVISKMSAFVDTAQAVISGRRSTSAMDSTVRDTIRVSQSMPQLM
jgi:hypothetical protein